jgi:hypothetical protein
LGEKGRKVSDHTSLLLGSILKHSVRNAFKQLHQNNADIEECVVDDLGENEIALTSNIRVEVLSFIE